MVQFEVSRDFVQTITLAFICFDRTRVTVQGGGCIGQDFKDFKGRGLYIGGGLGRGFTFPPWKIIFICPHVLLFVFSLNDVTPAEMWTARVVPLCPSPSLVLTCVRVSL